MIRDTIERPVEEYLLLTLFLALSVWFLLEPAIEGYAFEAAFFPQANASIVLVGCLLLLFRDRLPGPVRRFVTEDVSLLAGEADGATETEEPGDDEAVTPSLGHELGLPIPDTLFMTAWAVAFAGAGWAVGLLYVAPVFVFGYTTWFRIDAREGLLIALFTTAVVYGFVQFLHFPFDQGQFVLRGGLP